MSAIEQVIEAAEREFPYLRQTVAAARIGLARLNADVAELEDVNKNSLKSWTALMRELAKLSDAMGLDDGDWSEADDSTLVEQFDPWTVVAAAICKSKNAFCAGVESAAQVVDKQIEAYPESVFIPPPDGQHGKTVDACSAAALRAVLPVVARKIRQLAEPEQDHAPIGKIRAGCVDCGTKFECYLDDLAGWDDDVPFYRCEVCQSQRS